MDRTSEVMSFMGLEALVISYNRFGALKSLGLDTQIVDFKRQSYEYMQPRLKKIYEVGLTGIRGWSPLHLIGLLSNHLLYVRGISLHPLSGINWASTTDKRG